MASVDKFILNDETLNIKDSTARADIDALTTRTGTLETTAADLGGRMTTAESNITNLGGRMTTAESDIDNLQAADTAISGRMTTAESDIDDLQAADTSLGSRVTALEAAINTGGIKTYPFSLTTSGGGYINLPDMFTASRVVVAVLFDQANYHMNPGNNGGGGWGGKVYDYSETAVINMAVTGTIFYVERS